MEERILNDGFVPFSTEGEFKCAKDLHGIRNIIALDVGTCTMRAAKKYREMKEQGGDVLEVQTVRTFYDAIKTIRNDIHAAMLIPELHELQKHLANDTQFENIASQNFQYPNPGLHIATPKQNYSDRTYLWTLPTLYPLVEEQFNGHPPFEEIVPAETTQDAALHCSKIFGGGFCVTNDEGLESYELISVKKLRHIIMHWFLYRKTKKIK